jgi:hypothetical protein
MRNGEVHQQLDEFKRSLLLLAKAELPDANFHADHVERFDYAGHTYTTEWLASEEQGWRFFRLNEGSLAQQLLEQARDRTLETVRVCFDYSSYVGNLSDVANLAGRGGWLALYRLTLATPAKSYDDIIAVSITDDGELIDSETVERLMQVPASIKGDALTRAPSQLQSLAEDSQTSLIRNAQQRLGSFLAEEEDRLENWRDDAKVTFEAKIKELEKEARDKTKESRAVMELESKVALQREAGNLRRDADNLKQQYFERLKEIDNQREQMLDGIAEQLSLTPTLTPLYTIQWEVHS